MSTVPHTPQGQQSIAVAAPTRTNTVIMGQQGFIRVLLRLIGVEMYKIRRRVLSKALSIIGLSVMIAAFLVLSINAFVALNTPLQGYELPQCSALQKAQGKPIATPSSGQTCSDHPPTQQELAEAQKFKQLEIFDNFAPLRLPYSVFNAISVIMIVGTILLIILVGTIVGGEYSGGTVRLVLTRGPTRTQFLLSKIGALLICVVLGFVMMLLTGLVVGVLLTLPSGIATPLDFLQHGGWVHVLLYPLVALFGLFVCTMLALFLATLGRATVAGVAGALVWFVLESVLSGVLNLLHPGPVANFLKAIPDYFISNNISILLHSQTNYFITVDPYFMVNPPSAVSILHALFVLIGYLTVFIALSLWVSIRRDITN